jgi:hypothetical protein
MSCLKMPLGKIILVALYYIGKFDIKKCRISKKPFNRRFFIICLVSGSLETYDASEWVLAFLKVLHKRKRSNIKSLEGTKYDILELGGGDASSIVILPSLLDKFVAPYDAVLIQLSHSVGQRIIYQTCGSMMPIQN